MKSDDELIEELQHTTAGLLMMSESDYPFEVISIDSKTQLTTEYLRERAGKTSSEPVTTTEVHDFFRNSTSEATWKNEPQIAAARRFQGIVRLFEEEFSETKVYRIGNIDI